MLVVELSSRLFDVYACVQLAKSTRAIGPISLGYVSLLLRVWVIHDSFSEFADFSEVSRSPTFLEPSMSNIFSKIYIFQRLKLTWRMVSFEPQSEPRSSTELSGPGIFGFYDNLIFTTKFSIIIDLFVININNFLYNFFFF